LSRQATCSASTLTDRRLAMLQPSSQRKPRITTWGNPCQFVVHRDDDRLLIDTTAFNDEAAMWSAVHAWIGGTETPFALETKLAVEYHGMFAVYRTVVCWVERGHLTPPEFCHS
jgi:hypothetical protein